jgi:hypothetical protein
MKFVTRVMHPSHNRCESINKKLTFSTFCWMQK